MGNSDVPSPDPDAPLAIWREKTRPGQIAPQRRNFVRDSICDTKKTMPRRHRPSIFVCVLGDCDKHASVHAHDFVESSVLISHQFGANPEPNNALTVLEEGLDRKS